MKFSNFLISKNSIKLQDTKPKIFLIKNKIDLALKKLETARILISDKTINIVLTFLMF